MPTKTSAADPERELRPGAAVAERNEFDSTAGSAAEPKSSPSSPSRAPRPGDRSKLSDDANTAGAPKIYYLHYPMLGPLRDWPGHLARCRAMGFDYIAVPPVFAPGALGNVFLTADFDRPNPILGLSAGQNAVAAIATLCGDHGLRLILDLVVDRVASDGPIAAAHASWFHQPTPGDTVPDPRQTPTRDAATARFERPEIAQALATWWAERLRQMIRAGAAGFRCLGLDRAPAALWRGILADVRQESPRCLVLASSADLTGAARSDLASLQFDGVVARVDGTGAIEEMAALRRIAPVIAAPELPFRSRLTRFGGAIPAPYRRGLAAAAALGDGLLVPIGFEFAASRPLDPIYSVPADLSEAQAAAPFILEADIAAANNRLDRIAALRLQGHWRRLDTAGAVATLLRTDAADPRRAEQGLVLLVNGDDTTVCPLEVPLAPLPQAAGAAFEATTPLDGDAAPDAPLLPGEARLLRVTRTRPVATAQRSGRHAAQQAGKAARIAIEAVTPAVDGGRFAAKRIVGETVEVEADIFVDGHDALAAALLWRAADETEWSRAPFDFDDNDRWRGAFRPRRVGRHFFTVEAWLDRWTGLRRDLEKKHAAGQDVTPDIADAVVAIEAAEKRAAGDIKRQVQKLRAALSGAESRAGLALILSPDTAAIMAAADERPFLARSEPELAVDVDRPQAGFASWYEMFPRSATDDPARHGTFNDVARRLPEIAAMGFDVLYFPPIHPIGATNRKGRNNALTAAPDDPGSPYAIGSAEGGHTAIHPALGTIDDFRRVRDAAQAQGLEIALDFAVQCAPDHPWIKEHPDWFRHRADGSIRYAENPPKKYEDIVNPDFYAPKAVPDLWLALRDAVLFWIGEGIRIFRVDNPHTKPLPFWEWLIADIRARQPDTIFLAEAFTRPKPMYRLAKLGFTQSYTYFTWRNTKWELTAYLRELADGPARDFFRPNFFVNTPDINPFFLQLSGRAGFLIRAALAATLAGAWGMYSGFELCEAAPLPGREEYLDAEKYEIRVRDFAASGNIVAEIAMLNRIRRNHVELQSHLGVTFYNAVNDQILIYGKARRHRGEPLRAMILIAVNLDPRQIQEAMYELPLWEFGLPDDGTLAVEDLVRAQRFALTGKYQQMRLDPSVLPFAIWRLSAGNA